MPATDASLWAHAIPEQQTCSAHPCFFTLTSCDNYDTSSHISVPLRFVSCAIYLLLCIPKWHGGIIFPSAHKAMCVFMKKRAHEPCAQTSDVTAIDNICLTKAREEKSHAMCASAYISKKTIWRITFSSLTRSDGCNCWSHFKPTRPC